MALKIVTGGTTGAADGTLVSSGNPLVITALNTAINAHIRCDDGFWSSDQHFDVPAELQVSFDGGSTWYGNADEPITAPEIYAVNVPIKIRQTAAAGSTSGSFTTDGTYTAIAALTTPTLTVTPGNTQNALSWTNVANEDASPGYTVEVSNDGSSWSALTTTAQNVTTYTHTGLTNGVIKYYRVKAEGSGRYSDSSYGTGNGTPAAPSLVSVITGTSGIIDYWKFDEASGTSAADAIGSLTGTAGAHTTVAVSGIIPSDSSRKCFQFDGATSGGVDFGSVLQFTGTAAFSAGAFVRMTDRTNGPFVMGTWNGTNGWRMGIGDAGYVYLQRGANFIIADQTVCAINKTYFVAVTFDGTNIRLYVYNVTDNVATGIQTVSGSTATASSASIATAGNFRIGCCQSGVFGMTGKIDEPFVANTALSGSALAAIFTAAL